jgi:hypothetical protein
LLSDCDGGLCLWDLADLGVRKSVEIYVDMFSVDAATGAFFVGENHDQGWRIEVVRPTDERRVVTSSSTGKLRAFEYSQASNLLAFVTGNRVSLLDLGSGTTVWATDLPADGDVHLAFAREGSSLLGVVISKTVSGEKAQQEKSNTHFLTLDVRTGEKHAEIERQTPSPIVGIAGIKDESKPAFITVTRNGVVET